MELRKKTIFGALWNALELFSGKFIQIFVTIILARILVPADFGTIALLVIFTELSKVLLDSGFSQALIRKKNATEEDYNSIFYFNILIGIILYTLLYTLSPFISNFYNYPELTNIARIVFLTIIINSFGIVQNAIVIRDINFKVLAKRTIIANLLAGILAIYMANNGFGVWSLVIQIVVAALLRVVLLWITSNWKPSLNFSINPIKKLFSFSVNLLFTGVIDVIASNIQMLLIGKYYTSADLGFYSQSKILSAMPSQILTSIVKNVTYPVLSVINNDLIKVKQAYRKIITIAMFVIVPVMLILVAIGNNLIPFVLGEKWIPSVEYFMLLSFVGAIYPLYSINQNIFLARGNSKSLLKVSIIQKLIAISGIVITIQISVLALVISYMVTTLINTLIIMYYAGKEINYTFKEQINDIIGIVSISFLMFTIIYMYGIYSQLENPLLLMFFQIVMGMVIYLILAYVFKLSILEEFKDISLSIKNKV